MSGLPEWKEFAAKHGLQALNVHGLLTWCGLPVRSSQEPMDHRFKLPAPARVARGVLPVCALAIMSTRELRVQLREIPAIPVGIPFSNVVAHYYSHVPDVSVERALWSNLASGPSMPTRWGPFRNQRLA